VCREDFEVAAWLIDMGASLNLVKSFLETIIEDEQHVVLNQVLKAQTERIIQGHSILFSFLELNQNVPGLSAVVEKVMEVENPDAYFAVFYIPQDQKVFLIARSQKERIDLHHLLHEYGGGGHQLAASATISSTNGLFFFQEFLDYLEKSLVPAVRAREIMSKNVCCISENKSLLEAAVLLEETNHSGLPVLNDQGEITGFIGLKDIMKGRKAQVMKAPVSAYMRKPAIIADASITIREVERLFYKHHVGHIPVTEANKLIGIITRWDYLRHLKEKDRDAQ
jgi:tRNA nucleotidyltransferase (CCA-adding enzyme)